MTTSFAAAAATSSSPDADPRAEEPNPFEESFALAATKRLPSDHHQTEQVKFMTEVASSLNHNSTAAAVVLPSIDKLAVSSTAISTMVDNPPLKLPNEAAVIASEWSSLRYGTLSPSMLNGPVYQHYQHHHSHPTTQPRLQHHSNEPDSIDLLHQEPLPLPPPPPPPLPQSSSSSSRKRTSKSKLKTPTPQEHGILAAATSSLSAVVRERGDSVGSESVSPLINQTPSDKKRRTNSDTAGGDSADPQEMERRRSFLERNRQAALKCRLRKKQQLEMMQNQVVALNEENMRLKLQANSLQEEVINLRNLLLAHGDCSKSHAPPSSSYHGLAATSMGTSMDYLNGNSNNRRPLPPHYLKAPPPPPPPPPSQLQDNGGRMYSSQMDYVDVNDWGGPRTSYFGMMPLPSSGPRPLPTDSNFGALLRNNLSRSGLPHLTPAAGDAYSLDHHRYPPIGGAYMPPHDSTARR